MPAATKSDGLLARRFSLELDRIRSDAPSE